MTEELKSCPFCGKSAHPAFEPRIVRDLDAYLVQCPCGVKGGAYISEELAIKAWNTRAPNEWLKPTESIGETLAKGLNARGEIE